jgi:hypothetical protein
LVYFSVPWRLRAAGVHGGEISAPVIASPESPLEMVLGCPGRAGEGGVVRGPTTRNYAKSWIVGKTKKWKSAREPCPPNLFAQIQLRKIQAQTVS